MCIYSLFVLNRVIPNQHYASGQKLYKLIRFCTAKSSLWRIANLSFCKMFESLCGKEKMAFLTVVGFGEYIPSFLQDFGFSYPARQGQDKPHSVQAFHPTAQATGNERCPVRFYKDFTRRRPVEMKRPDSPFYLAVKRQRKPGDNVWYMRSPLGKNEIAKFLTTTGAKKCWFTRQTHQPLRAKNLHLGLMFRSCFVMS